jgi:Zn-dependent M28 family amino/carboxypeptidase
LARSDEKGRIHYGADDNASGVGAVLEIAHFLAELKAQGHLSLKRDILFAAWAGEELGLLGSTYFTRTFGGGPNEAASLAPPVVAYLNLDMIGRLDKSLALQGIGSSSIWRDEIARANAAVGVPLSLQDDSYVPSDATAFYLKGVPILSAFTGAHEDYHTPRDTADKINYNGAADITRLMAILTRSLATRLEAPDYRLTAQPDRSARRANIRVYLGTIPDYSQSEVSGLKVAGVVSGGPAAQAGVQGGDVIVELAGKTIEHIYDYTYALNAIKVGVPTRLVVLRGQERLTLTVTPASRQ